MSRELDLAHFLHEYKWEDQAFKGVTALDNVYPQAIQVISAKHSDRGQSRPNNEDFALLFEPNDSYRLEHSGSLYVVADGVGGSRDGEKASQYAAERVVNEYYQQPGGTPGDRLRELLQHIGNDMYDEAAQSGKSRTATTMVAAVVQGGWVTVANVGDSRAYLIHDGQAMQITRDHNQLAELLRMGMLSEAEAQHSNARNTLLRSLGGHRDVEVDIFENILLSPGDIVLLCTDGLSRYLRDDQLPGMLTGGAPDEICTRLIDYANHCGGEDNITVLVAVAYAVDAAVSRRNAPPPMRRVDPLETVRLAQPGKVKSSQTIRRNALAPWKVYTLYGLIALVGIAALVFAGVLIMQTIGKNGRVVLASTATSAVIGIDDTPTAASDAARLPIVTIQPSLAAEAAIAGTPNPASVTPSRAVGEVAACVQKVAPKQTLSLILQGFNLKYDDTATYYYFSTCTSTTCTGPHTQIQTHGSIQVGWFIDIPTDADNCQKNGGLWLKVQ